MTGKKSHLGVHIGVSAERTVTGGHPAGLQVGEFAWSLWCPLHGLVAPRQAQC